MARVWNKIGHADKKYKSGLITSLQIPITWPSSDIPPLKEEFDWAANSRYSKMVLEGTYSNLELTFLESKLL
eukprot:4564518-Ditylum_brightwellii.AAC.1